MTVPKYINIDPQGISAFELRDRLKTFVEQSTSLEWRVEDQGIVVKNTDGSTTQMHPRQGIQTPGEFHIVQERKGRIVVFVLKSESVYNVCQTFAGTEGCVVSQKLDWDAPANTTNQAEQGADRKPDHAPS